MGRQRSFHRWAATAARDAACSRRPSATGKRSTPRPARCPDRPAAPRSAAAAGWQTRAGWRPRQRGGALAGQLVGRLSSLCRGRRSSGSAASAVGCAATGPVRPRPAPAVLPPPRRPRSTRSVSRRSGRLIIRPRPSPRAPRLFFATPAEPAGLPAPHPCAWSFTSSAARRRSSRPFPLRVRAGSCSAEPGCWPARRLRARR